MTNKVEANDDDDLSGAMQEEIGETSKDDDVLVSLAEISEFQLPVDSEAKIVHSDVWEETDEISPHMTNLIEEKAEDEKTIESKAEKRVRSECRPHSRNTRQCQKLLQEMIGKHEFRNEELEQREGCLRKRLETLECSMPAVMVWNICKMTQGAPTSDVLRLMEKQLQGYDDDNVATTPSKHWDERVRKIEAKRKEALRRATEARVILAEKEAAVEERKKCLEEANKCKQQRKEKMEKLKREAAELEEALKNARGDDKSCETGDCGVIKCREKWLEGVGRVNSIGSMDLECFGKLQDLAEAEICMRRQISELERREEAYMKTLQQADEMWSKMEGDSAVTVSELQNQLDLKATANQQLADRICQLEDELESLKTKNINCNDALARFTEKEHKEVGIGLDDGEATVRDRAVVAAVKTATASAYASPGMVNQESLAHPETVDGESSVVPPDNIHAGVNANPSVLNKSSEAIPAVDQIHQGLDPITVLGIDSSVGDEENVPEHREEYDPETVDVESNVVASDDIDAGVHAIPSVLDKSSEAIPVVDRRHQGLDPITVLGIDSRVEDEENVSEPSEDYDEIERCPSTTICDDMLDGSMETQDISPKRDPSKQSKVQATPERVEQIVGEDRIEDVANVQNHHMDATEPTRNQSAVTDSTKTRMGATETMPASDQILLSREELHNWYNIVDSVQHSIAKSDASSLKTSDIAQLAERMKSHLRIKSVAGVKVPMITEGTVREPMIMSAEVGIPTPSSAVSVNRTSLPTGAEIHALEKIVEIGKKISLVENDKVARFNSSEISKEGVSTEVASNISIPTEVSEVIATAQVPPDVEIISPDTLHNIPETNLAEHGLLPVDKKASNAIEKVQLVENLNNAVVSPENIEVESLDSTAVENFTESTTLVDAAKPRPDVEELTDIPGSLTEIPVEFAEEVEKVVSVGTVGKLEFTDPAELPAVPSEFSPPQDAIKKGRSSVNAEEETIIQAPLSFVTLRTPPPSKINITPKIRIPSSVDLTDEFELALDGKGMPSDEIDVEEEDEGLLSTKENVPGSAESMPEVAVQISVTADSLGLESYKITIPATDNDKQPAAIIDADESPELEPDTSAGTEEAPNVKSEAEPEIPEAQNLPDVIEIEQSQDKLARDSIEEKISLAPNRPSVGQSYSESGEIESSEKLESLKPGVVCICTPPTRPLLEWNAAVEAELKDLSKSRIITERTQIKPLIPKILDQRSPNNRTTMISAESVRPCPAVEKWHRGPIWFRRPRDKPTLSAVSIDTQTDTALVRKKATRGGIAWKEDCTCLGLSPTKSKESGLVGQTSKPPPARSNVTEPFDSGKFLVSMACSAEKSLSRDNEICCVECGQPLTTEKTSPPTASTVPTGSKCQKNVLSSSKKMSSSITHMTHKNSDFTCCQCKKSRKNKSSGKSRHRREKKKYLEEDACCPCRSKTSKRPPHKSSRRKSKPETKDQSILVHIPRDTVSKTEHEKMDVKPGIASDDLESYCECEESTNDGNIAEGESSGGYALDGTSKGNVSCDCCLNESVSRGSSCNCAGDT